MTNVVREAPGDQEEYSDQEQEIDSDSGLPGKLESGQKPGVGI